jgi:NADPH:quinone reductase-like Zn-dependent oxidoreductase
MSAATLAHRPAGLSEVDAGWIERLGRDRQHGQARQGPARADPRRRRRQFRRATGQHLGAAVAATAGSKNVEFVRSLGADQVIDYSKTDFSTAIKDIDLVFDLIGGDTRFKSFPVLKPGGVISHISVPPMTQAPPRSDVEVKPAPVRYDATLLEQVTALVKSKAVQPTVTEVFPFNDALKSFEHVMTGHARGKVMLDMTQ